MFLRREHLAALVVAVSLAASTQPAYAQWNVNGVPLCTAMSGPWEMRQTMVTDSLGGAIVTWMDYRDGNEDIYVQRVDAAGVVQWAADGVALCTAAGDQSFPTIATDGSGGAFVTWQDSRPGGSSNDVYAQHVLSTGAVDPAWPADGYGLSTAGGNGQELPDIISDGSGSAIVAWACILDGFDGIYAQHVLASGVDPTWPANGVLCSGGVGKNGALQKIVTDGAGGAIVTWLNQGHAPIYTQHVLASGVVDSVWTNANGNIDGTPLSTTVYGVPLPAIATDGAGGAIVTWTDTRSGGYGIYAQRMSDRGVTQWGAEGTPLGTAANNQWYPTIATDGSGGAIVTWFESSYGPVYAQHVLASGVDPAWPVNGRGLCTAASTQQYPTIVPAGSGDAIVAWQDGRSGSSDIYAQRIYANGGVSAVATGGPSYSFAVQAPHPNPANAQATISFDLASPQPVSVRVYDVTGRLVRTLAAGGELPTGSHSLIWNGASDSGTLAHAGIYFIRLSAGSAVQTRRVAIIR